VTGSPGWRAVLVAAATAGTWLVWLGLARATAPRSRWQRSNFRGAAVTLAGGLAGLVAIALGAALLAGGVGVTGARSDVRRIALAVLVAAGAAGVIGLVDDLLGDSRTKGFRGHLGALRHGRASTGLAKVVVIVAGAAVAAMVLGDGAFGRQQLVDTGVIAGSANLINLLDLRPGRALKAVLAVALPVTFLADSAPGLVAAWPAGVAAGLLSPDLSERSMLGDGGANALGAAVGTVLAASGGLLASALVLAGLVALTATSEVVSFSALIERTPGLRGLDRLGRRP